MGKGPSSSRRDFNALDLAFRFTRAFVARVDPSMAFVRLKVDCPEVMESRLEPGVKGQRAFMHVGHLQGTVCAWSGSAGLAQPGAEGYLFGLLLHEFGHLGSRGGELAADAWVFDNFGIRIHYKSKLDLEWVDAWAVRRIISSAQKAPPSFRHNVGR